MSACESFHPGGAEGKFFLRRLIVAHVSKIASTLTVLYQSVSHSKGTIFLSPLVFYIDRIIFYHYLYDLSAVCLSTGSSTSLLPHSQIVNHSLCPTPFLFFILSLSLYKTIYLTASLLNPSFFYPFLSYPWGISTAFHTLSSRNSYTPAAVCSDRIVIKETNSHSFTSFDFPSNCEKKVTLSPTRLKGRTTTKPVGHFQVPIPLASITFQFHFTYNFT